MSNYVPVSRRPCTVPNCAETITARNCSGYCGRHRRNLERKKYNARNPKKVNARKKVWDLSVKGKFSYGKREARRRRLEWTLGYEDYGKLIAKGCEYCSTPLDKCFGVSLDRLDNKIGYIGTNVVPCCKNCNWLKSDLLSFEETKEVIKVIQAVRGISQIWNRSND